MSQRVIPTRPSDGAAALAPVDLLTWPAAGDERLDPRGGDAMDRIINGLAKAVPAV